MDEMSNDNRFDETAELDGRVTDSSMNNFVSQMRGFLDKSLVNEELFGGNIGRFEIRRELGRGTFGVVLLVYDPALNCERALKIPTEAALNNSLARHRFVKESQFAGAIDHLNVVRVLEADDLGGLCYLVMEHCPEGSLSSWMKARPKGWKVPEKWAALLVAQIADGVHQAHLKGILHRDLKPGNVLLVRVGADVGSETPDFCPKVADFGLAKLLEGDVGMSVDDAPVGTYAYMSPEQVRGNSRQIGPLSDVYGLGTILFELLAGSRAYPQETREELLKATLSDTPPPSLKEARPGVSKGLEILCRTCLAKDPRDRYTSAAVLADNLRKFHRGEAVPGDPLWKKARSFARRHPRAKVVVAAMVMVAVIVGAFVERWKTIEARETGEIEIYLREVEAADISALSKLVASKIAPTNPRVATHLKALFQESDSRKTLNAAVILAGTDPKYADYAFDRLLSVEASDIGPLARALLSRSPGIVDSLEAAASKITTAKASEEVERLDRRRANAATALVLIGRVRPGLDVLIFTPEPQARSFLIHRLGPADTPPRVLLDALKTDDDSIRLSLLQAIGEIPDAIWEGNKEIKAAIIAEAKRLYVENPDSGVHGSAKWLLRHWGFKADLKTIDEQLKGKKLKSEFGWRITKTGLTMVIVRDPKLRQAIEVSDCEITVEQFLDEFVGHKYIQALSPDPDSPINNVDFSRSGAFCNRISLKEGFGEDELAFKPEPNGKKMLHFPVEGREPRGFRLPTEGEFVVFSSARSEARCYFGASFQLMHYYALIATPAPRMTIARFKPNDLGLFDTLGNVGEWARSDNPNDDRRNQAVACGGRFNLGEEWLVSQVRTEPSSIDRIDQNLRHFGFRVVRTLDSPPR